MAQTAKHEARHVAGEVSTQARRVAQDMRGQVRDKAQQGHGTLVNRLRQTADELRDMSSSRDDSPARTLVASLAERTSRLAEQLEAKGPDGVLSEVQEFARRRPGTFLIAAAAAGFVVGRVGKSVLSAPNGPLSSTPSGAREPTMDSATELVRDGGAWSDPQPTAVATGTVYQSGGSEPVAVPDEPLPPAGDRDSERSRL
ncbi:MAG TPA: hypothetical protein VFR67_30510 [Pilimelia sp.]|nr:hypothetical protein [Pilimelia sp.]